MDTSLPSQTTPAAPGLAEDLAVDPRVAAFLAEVREDHRAPLPASVTATHLRMILAESAVAPTAPSITDRWARRARRIAAIGAVKIALTATAAAAATGTGLAATGNLPDAAQTAVAEAAERVGITIPSPAHDTPGDRTDDAGDPMPGIGEGGVPALLDGEHDPDDLPGKAGTAPGLNKDEDGRPALPEPERRPEQGQQPEDTAGQADTAGEDRGTGQPDARPGTAKVPTDTPAAERPEAPVGGPAVDGDDEDDTRRPSGQRPDPVED